MAPVDPWKIVTKYLLHPFSLVEVLLHYEPHSVVVTGYPQVAAKRRQSTTFASASTVRTDGLPKKAIANAYVHRC